MSISNPLRSMLNRADLLHQLSTTFRQAEKRLSTEVHPGETLADLVKRTNTNDQFSATPKKVIAHSIQHGFHKVELPEDRLGTGLCEALGGSLRSSGIPGLPKALDPHAYEILFNGDYRALEEELAGLGFRDLHPLRGGGGFSAVVIQTGDQSKVIRLQPVLPSYKYTPRMNLPEMLQAEQGGVAGAIKYEVLPKVDTQSITEADVQAMEERLASRGYQFSDPGTDNLGRLPNGKVVVIDPDAIIMKRS